jgi:tetratricopeptide (TPR) repeat protein
VVLLGSQKEADLKGISLLEEATQKDPTFAIAYCLTANAHDDLYSDRIDHTPERRALADAAVNEALRLRPDLPEVRLALANHLWACYRDFKRARVQIAIAAQALSNNANVLELTASIDQVEGRWEKATACLERAATLDPLNLELLEALRTNYWCQRRYGDFERILDRAFELKPDEPRLLALKAMTTWAETADVTGAREILPSSAKR